MSPVHYYNLGYAEVFLFQSFIISQVKEGRLLLPEHNNELKELIAKHYLGRPLVYISNRAFNYSVSPMTYMETARISNLIGMCIVTTTPSSQQTAKFEGQFYKKEFYVASTIEEAILWSSSLVSNYLDNQNL
jgi:hypothetical protein